MLRKFRRLSVLSLLVLVAVVASACQPVYAEPAKVTRSVADIADELIGVRASVVVDAVGPSQATDPAQAQLEDEFRTVALAREQAYYEQDAARFIAYYADQVISLEPGTPDKVGKAIVTDGLQGYLEGTQLVGEFTLKGIWVSGNYGTRWGEWHEVTRPAAGGEAEHHVGRCVVGWQKIDGEWKVVSQVINFVQESTPAE